MSTIDISAGTIHYEAAGPENGRPVVFVHGYLMAGDLWRRVSKRLADRGLRCIAPTWPLGAQPQQTFLLVVRGALRLVAGGVLLGLAGAAALGKSLAFPPRYLTHP